MAFPLIAPGCEGTAALTVTVNDCGVLLPQALLAFTVMLPLILPDVTVIELLVDVPDQPDGIVQV